MRLENMAAVVTGATRGLGLAIAEAFVAEGANVILTGRSETDGTAAAKALGARARFVKYDLDDPKSGSALIAAADKAFGKIDILVNNAGTLHRESLLDMDLAAYEQVMRVNLSAPVALTQAAARIMVREKSGGSVINVSSTGAAVCRPGGTPYHVSKAGLAMFTRVAALDLGPYGIRVNCIGPGAFPTELMLGATNAKIHTDILAATPLGRFGHPSEIASVATFLASRESSYLTGQSIYVDGGRLTLNPTQRAEPRAEWLNDSFRR